MSSDFSTGVFAFKFGGVWASRMSTTMSNKCSPIVLLVYTYQILCKHLDESQRDLLLLLTATARDRRRFAETSSVYNRGKILRTFRRALARQDWHAEDKINGATRMKLQFWGVAKGSSISWVSKLKGDKNTE